MPQQQCNIYFFTFDYELFKSLVFLISFLKKKPFS